MKDLSSRLLLRWSRATLLALTAGFAALLLSAVFLMPAAQPVAGHPMAQAPTPTPTCSVARVYGYQPTPTAMVPAFNQAAQNDPNTANARPAYTSIARGIPTQYPGGTGITYVSVSPSQPIPDRLLKAIGWQEGWRQSSNTRWHQFDAPYGGYGYTLRAGCDYGVMQINENSMGGMDSSRIAGEYPYNIGAGTRILIDKWNWMCCITPTYRLISPNNHTLAENWYYAVTAYNGWSEDNDPNNTVLYEATRPPFDGTQLPANYPYQELIWGYMAHPGSPPGGGQLWSPVRVPWVPRGIFGIWQPGNWRPPEWTPRPTFYYLPDIKANYNGWNSRIVIQNPRSDLTLAVDIAFYNPNGDFYKWWLEWPERDDSPPMRLAPRASRVLRVVDGLPPGASFSGSAVIAASQDIAVSVIRVYQGTPYTCAIYNAVETVSNKVYVPLLHRNNNYWNSEIIIQNAGSQDAQVTVYYHARTGNSCSTSVTIPSLGSYTFDLKNNPGCNIGSPFVGAATISSTQPIAVVANQLRDDGANGTVESLMNYEGFATGAVYLFAPMLMRGNNDWDSGLAIYNHNASSNSIQIGYNAQQGESWSGSQTIASGANGIVTIHPAPPDSVSPPIPFVGSAVLSAQVGKPISAIVNEIRSTATSYPAMCYRMATEGGKRFVVPLAFKDKLNWMGWSYWSTGLMVQNLSTTSNASVTVTCYAADGTQAGSASYTVSPRRSKVVFPLPTTVTDFLGSVVVTADQDVAVAVNHIVSGSTEDTAMSHTGIKR